MQLTKRAFLLSGAALAVSAASGAFAMGTPSGFAVVGFALKTVESTLSQIRRRRARGTSGLWPSSP